MTSKPAAISAQQAEEIADKVVTADEYHAAFARFRACLSAAGFEVLMGAEFNDTYQYSVPFEAVDTGVDTPCYDGEFDRVDSIWQLAHIDGSQTGLMVRACVVAHGLPPHERERDNFDELDRAGIPISECSG